MVNPNDIPLLSHLRSSIGLLAGVVTEAIEEAMQELDGVKLDKPEIAEAAIPATGWSSDGTAGYPYYYDLAVTGVTAADIAVVTLPPASVRTAVACGMCPTNETIAGAIRFRAAEVPAQAVAVEYEIAKGKGSE